MIALYENDTPAEFRMLDADHPENVAELHRHWPLGKFPLLIEGEIALFEATIVIEYLQAFHAGRLRLIPSDPNTAIKVRQLDCVFDNYVMDGVQAIVGDALRPDADHDPYGTSRARERLDKIYAWLDGELADRAWADGSDVTLADCAAAPSLFYADWVHPIADKHSNVTSYRAGVLARPSVARCVEDARPYRSLFPLGAPDRD